MFQPPSSFCWNDTSDSIAIRCLYGFVLTGHRTFSHMVLVLWSRHYGKRGLVTVLCSHVLWSQATELFLISYGSGIVITSIGEEGAGYCTVCPCFVVTGHRTFSHTLWFWHCDHVTRGRGRWLQYCVSMFCGHRLQNFFSYLMVLALWSCHYGKRGLVTVLCAHVLWTQATEHFLKSFGSGIVITSLREEGAGYCTVCRCFVVTGHRAFSHILWFWHCDHVTRGRGSWLLHWVPMFCGYRSQNFFSNLMVLALWSGNLGKRELVTVLCAHVLWLQATELFLKSFGSGIVITSLGEEGAGYCTVCPCFVVTGHRTLSHILWFWHCDHVTRGRRSWLQYCVSMFCGHRLQNFFSYLMVLALWSCH